MTRPRGSAPTADIELSRVDDIAEATTTKHDDEFLANITSYNACENTATATGDAAAGDIPDGGYGWVVVVCVFMINANTWGPDGAYGVLLAYYLSHSTFPDGNAVDFAFISGLSISQALLVSPIVTSLIRRTSMRTSLVLGIVLQTAALIGASFATKTWQLFLSQGICFGWGMGFLYVGSAGIIPQWFSRHRSLANGIASSGVGFGGLAYALAVAAMIESIGLQWALRVVAIVSCVLNALATVLIRDRNKDLKPNQAAFDVALFRRPEFLFIVAWGFLSELGYVVLYFSLPDYALSVGLSAQQGSIISAMLNLGLGVGRPVTGYLSDAVGRLNMATGMTAFCALICLLIWVFAKSFGLLCFCALLAGCVCGTFYSTIAPVAVEVVGLKDLPTALSMTFMLMCIPTTFSEAIALKLRRPDGDVYLDAQLFTGCMYLGAAACIWLVRGWKVAALRASTMKEGSRDDRARGLDDSAYHAIDMAIGLVTWKRV